MKTRTQPIVVTLLVLLIAASLVRAADMTTYVESGDNVNRIGRYLVNLGRVDGDSARSIHVPDGLFDYPRRRGNQQPWYVMNDGNLVSLHAVTFHHYDPGTNDPEFFGYKFKAPATVTSLYLVDYSFPDGGPFSNATPYVQVLTGSREGTWTTVGATWNPSYNNTLQNGRSLAYEITLNEPATNVWGVRLYGYCYFLAADTNGFVACRELIVYGTPHFGNVEIILTNNVARESGVAIMSHAQYAGQQARIIDSNVSNQEANRNTTYGSSATRDWFGVMWPTKKNNIGAVGWVMRRFSDGGWIKQGTLDVEVATVTGGGSVTNWTSVSGLNRAVYDHVITNVLQVLDPPFDTGFLFTFNEVSDIDGIRIIGEPGGTADGNGFVGVIEFEVFRVIPEPGAVVGVLAGMALLRRRR